MHSVCPLHPKSVSPAALLGMMDGYQLVWDAAAAAAAAADIDLASVLEVDGDVVIC